MTFPRDVKDRAVEYPRRFQFVAVPGQTDVYDLVPVTGIVTEQGTAINKAYLQPLEDEVASILSGQSILQQQMDTKSNKLLPGDFLLNANDAGKQTYNYSYSKLKETKILAGGGVRVSFRLQGDDHPTTSDRYLAYGRIYVNGSPVGIQRSKLGLGYQTFVEDIDVEAGDLIQVYAYIDTTYAYKATVDNLRLYVAEIKQAVEMS